MSKRPIENGTATLRVNGRSIPFEERELSSLLLRLGYAADRPGIAVAVNGEIVRRGEWSRRELRPGDEIEIVGAVQGG